MSNTYTQPLIQNITVSRYSKTAFSTDLPGQLQFTQKTDTSNNVFITCTNLYSGLTQIVQVYDVSSNAIGAIFSIQFDVHGIVISGETTVDFSCPAFNTLALRVAAIANAVCTGDVWLYAALPVKINIPFASNNLKGKASADLSLGNYQGWVLYQQPTQAQLTADAPAPNNSWQPYFGDFTDIQINQALVSTIKNDETSPLTLADGTVANSYQYIWGSYTELKDLYLSSKYDGTSNTTSLTFSTLTSISASKVSIYVNGLYQRAATITISGNTINFSALSLNLGDTITVKISAYTPTSADLSFDPDTNVSSDNPLQLNQYKYDYQYTSKNIYDANGNLSQTLYYFWVYDKTIATYGRDMSISQAAKLLASNDNPYLILQDISSAQSYNQIIGIGLNSYISSDNRYSIKFTRDSILRNNPNGENLKNVHTEWTLMRPGQLKPIPQKLWNLLTDAAVGFDVLGNPVPSLANIAYDDRNGTTTRYGFNSGQAFVDSALALSSIKYTILNTKLTVESLANGGQSVPNPISFINSANIDELFSTPALIRQTMLNIWNNAQAAQINEIFFQVLNDALSEGYEMTDIFKTSFIAATSIKDLKVVEIA